MKEKHVAFSATIFNNFSSLDGINHKIITPKIGKSKIYNNKLLIYTL
jgi:hypothetical protein